MVNSLPVAAEVRVSGLHPTPSSSFIPLQRCFSGKTISKLFCSAASAAARLFVCWGEGTQQAEKQPEQWPPLLLALHFGKVTSLQMHRSQYDQNA